MDETTNNLFLEINSGDFLLILKISSKPFLCRIDQVSTFKKILIQKLLKFLTLLDFLENLTRLKKKILIHILKFKIKLCLRNTLRHSQLLNIDLKISYLISAYFEQRTVRLAQQATACDKLAAGGRSAVASLALDRRESLGDKERSYTMMKRRAVSVCGPHPDLQRNQVG